MSIAELKNDFPMRPQIIFLAVLLFNALSTLAQNPITGIVTDLRGEGLPFVHISINDQKDRVYTTEIDGAFSIPASPAVSSLTFTYVGHSTQRIEMKDASAGPLRIVLRQEAFTLGEAVVIAGENPAHRIIREAVKNRDRNNPDKLDGYRYRSFTKFTIRLLPNWSEIARREAMRRPETRRDRPEREENGPEPPHPDSIHLFIMETLTDHAFQRPQRRREEVLRHRTSGFEKAWFAGIAMQLQPFSFYRDELPFIEKRYLNPVSTGSTSRYRFRLENTFIDGPDSVFVISFQPNPGTAFSGLKGVLHIHSAGFAVQHFIAESADEEFIRFHIDQKYSRVEGGWWFPEQLSLVLEAEKYPDPSAGIRVNSRSYLDSVRINPEFSKRFFTPSSSYVEAPDVNQKDSLLELARKEPVSIKDSVTFAFWDSISQKVNLDGKMTFVRTLSEGAVPIGSIEWVYADLLRFNNFEGFNPGLGLRNSDRISKYFRLYGYAGYAFRAKQWKTEASLSVFPNPANRRFAWSAHYRNTLIEPATFDFPVQTQLVNRRYFAQRMDRLQSLGSHLAFRPMRFLEAKAGLQQQRHNPLFEYQFIPGEGTAPQTEFTFAEAELYLRFAYGARPLRLFGVEMELQSDFPVLYLRMNKGWKDLMGGQYDYLRVNAVLQHTFRHRRWGATRITAEGGWASPDLPYAKLFTPIGTGGGWDAFSLSEAFETMQPYEFLSNRSAHLYMEHHFNRLSKRSDIFQPQPVLIHRMGWGDLDRPELHDLEGLQTMGRGFFESGFAINSLLRVKYLNLTSLGFGVKALYRYGPYRLERFEDNVAVRLTMTFNR